MILPQRAPMGRRHRVSSDDCWPLRGHDGMTFAERKAARERTPTAQTGKDKGMLP